MCSWRIVLPVIALAFFSCNEEQEIHYRFTAMDAENVRNTSSVPSPVSDTAIPANAFGIRLHLHPEETYRTGRDFDPYTSLVSCDNPVAGIHVIADSSFGPGYPAGAVLNDHFILFNGSYLHTSPLNSSGLVPTAKFRADYADHPLPDYTEILLVTPPDTTRTFRFIIQLTLKDGTQWADTTNAVKLY